MEEIELDTLMKQAKEGDVTAQYRLGKMYLDGCDVEQDDEKALFWFEKAAQQGEPHAQYNLGWMYENGRGVEQSDETAVFWFEKAAQQGDPDAQRNLGWMYLEGRSVTQCDEAAAFWLKKAAQQGDPYAQCNLGDLYEEGCGMEQSSEAALFWYEKAAQQGYARGQCHLGLMYLDGCGVKQSIETGLFWVEKAAQQGCDLAQCILGYMYETGEGLPHSDETAVFWYTKAAQQDHAKAQYCLGNMHLNGRGVMQSDETAAYWFEKAAQQGDSDAQFNLGVLYERGRGVPQSDESAAYWYKKAAEQDNADAQCKLGTLYEEGRGVPQSDETAAFWLGKATQQGSTAARIDLDTLRMSGRINIGKATASPEAEKAPDRVVGYAEKYLQKAKRMIDQKEADLALLSLRQFLEFIVKQLCIAAQLEADTRSESLETMIDLLAENGVLTSNERSLFHSARKDSNRGAHVDLEDPCTIDEAQQAYTKSEEIAALFREKSSLLCNAMAGSTVNAPMADPNYYDKTRRTFGKWSRCYSREEILSNRDYVVLLRKAEGGDISAMLDLAVGFLSADRTTWNENGLLNFPYYTIRGTDYNRINCYDLRYYYWIGKAAARACEMYAQGLWEQVPKKLLATALLEELKLSYCTTFTPRYNLLINDLSRELAGVERRPSGMLKGIDQVLLIEQMFGEGLVPASEEMAFLLLLLMSEYPGRPIISLLQKEQKPEHIKYIMYCWSYYSASMHLDDMQKLTVQPWYAFQLEDAGHFATQEQLQRYCFDAVCERYYKEVTQICRSYTQKPHNKLFIPAIACLGNAGMAFTLGLLNLFDARHKGTGTGIFLMIMAAMLCLGALCFGVISYYKTAADRRQMEDDKSDLEAENNRIVEQRRG